jgi:hypothetical protein
MRRSNVSWNWGGQCGVGIAVLRTSLAAALVAGVFAAGGCSASPPCPPGASCPPPPMPEVRFIPTINGKSVVPGYPVRPSDARLYLTYTWSSHQPPASVSGAVAQLKLS